MYFNLFRIGLAYIGLALVLGEIFDIEDSFLYNNKMMAVWFTFTGMAGMFLRPRTYDLITPLVVFIFSFIIGLVVAEFYRLAVIPVRQVKKAGAFTMLLLPVAAINILPTVGLWALSDMLARTILRHHPYEIPAPESVFELLVVHLASGISGILMIYVMLLVLFIIIVMLYTAEQNLHIFIEVLVMRVRRKSPSHKVHARFVRKRIGTFDPNMGVNLHNIFAREFLNKVIVIGESFGSKKSKIIPNAATRAHIVMFQFDDGHRHDLMVSRAVFESLQKGDTGMVRYSGITCHSFRWDRQENGKLEE